MKTVLHRWFIDRSLFLITFVLLSLPTFGDSLDHWTSVSSGTTNRLWSVAFGNGVFVAAGEAGTVLTSSNGLAWVSAPTGVTNNFQGTAYGEGRFVVVGSSGLVTTSSNGVAWSVQPSGTPNTLYAITHTSLGFVAAGDVGTMITSMDGTNWTLRTSGTSQRLVGAGGGFGKIYVGAGGNSPAMFWSTNGTNWSTFTNVPVGVQPQLFNGGFVSGNGVLLGISSRGIFARSMDGVNWTNRSSPFFYCWGLAFAHGRFVAVGGGFDPGGGRMIATTGDGLAWQTRYNKNSESRMLGVAYGSQRFVAVGDGGAIMVSDPIVSLSQPLAGSDGVHLTINGSAGAAYRVQRTTNIISPAWEDVGVVTNAGDSLEFVAPPSENSPGAFYRVVTY